MLTISTSLYMCRIYVHRIYVQDLNPPSVELRVSLHVISDLMWSDLGLCQYSMEPGTAAQSAQAGRTCLEAMLPYMLLQQRVGPKFMPVTQAFRFSARAVLHPGDRIVGNETALARVRKISQRRFQPKRKNLANTTQWCGGGLRYAGRPRHRSNQPPSPAARLRAGLRAFLLLVNVGAFPVPASAPLKVQAATASW